MADAYRLSPQQAHLWAVGQGGADWLPRLALRLAGDLDTGRLEAALGTILARHDSLRTTPLRVPGLRAPLQQIEEPGAVCWTRPETAVPSLDRWEAPSLPEGGPGLGLSLFRPGEREHVLLISLPVLGLDDASLDNLFREIARELAGAGEDDAVQYLQYSEWQNDLLADEEAAPALAFWRERLARLGEVPTLAWQRSGGDLPPFAPERLEAGLAPSALGRAAGELEATEADVLLAAWQALLWRFAGERDCLVGWLSDGRSQEELKASLGGFAKRLPLEIPVSAGESFAGLVARTREARQEAEELQDYFAPKGDDGGDGRSLAWPFGFRWRAVPAEERAGGIVLNLLDTVSRVDRCLLELVAVRTGRGTALEIHWDRGAHHPDLVASLGPSLLVLLGGALAAPDSPVELLPLVPAGEVLRGEAPPRPEGTFVHVLLEDQAGRSPEALAVDVAGSSLTFGRLEAAANRLAHSLRRAGVGPDVPVGVCVDRSELALVGLLGVLKAGGAFLALDPTDPDERRRFLLQDSGAPVLLLGGAANDAPEGYPGAVVRLEPFAGVDATGNPEPPRVPLDPENLAYVIYTSGSTGTPKGVGITHRSLRNYLGFVERVLWPEGIDGWPWISRLTFDACLKQVFSPLLRGQPVWLLAEEVAGHPLGLLEALAGRGEVALNCVPTLWRAMLDGIEAGVVAAPADRLSRLLLGGERLTPELLARTRAAFPGTEVWNLYGPSETTANAAVTRIAAEPSLPEAVPIGRPLDHTHLVLADRGLQPVPLGMAGEILVGGAGVARGYLGRPGLTAERFVPDPFAQEPGARLYRTGDLGRLLPTGELEFLDRTDDQVKVRGIRIELGEIEAALREHPAVEEAAVVVHQEPNGDRNLVAYTVSRPGAAVPGATELRGLLRRRLPDSLLPAAFVPLDRFPLTPTGKVDRRSLPSPDLARAAAAERPYIAPRNETERMLAEIWASVLGRDRVGIEDDFFELGGHSIQSIQVSYQARQRGLEVSPRDLFENPTIAYLSRLTRSSAGAVEEGYEEGEL